MKICTYLKRSNIKYYNILDTYTVSVTRYPNPTLDSLTTHNDQKSFDPVLILSDFHFSIKMYIFFNTYIFLQYCLL